MAKMIRRKRHKVNGHRAVMASRRSKRGARDFLPTPPFATRALMERVLASQWAFDWHEYSCWEPACGEGHMVEVLKEYFGCVMYSDIHNYGYAGTYRGDFINEDFPAACADFIITNPPFDAKAEAFAHRALALARVGVALFLPLRWLEGVGRYERLFRDTPPTLIAPFVERVNLCKDRWNPKGTTATAYMWLVWIKGANPQPPYWIPPGCREQLTRPDDVIRFTAHPVIRKEQFKASTGEIREGEAA